MCVDGDILDLRIIKQTYFSCFLCGFKIETNVMHEHMMNNQKHVKNM